jgi:DNA-3-methyladenine glycosylase I
LSWLLVLKKRSALREAFAGFVVDTVADFGSGDVARLMGNAGIIRNRRKIEAVIDNARRLQEVRESAGGFAAWLSARHPLPLADWVKAFRATFAFCGPEVVNEFLLSIGYLPGAHREDCPVFAATAACNPPWRILTGTTAG